MGEWVSGLTGWPNVWLRSDVYLPLPLRGVNPNRVELSLCNQLVSLIPFFCSVLSRGSFVWWLWYICSVIIYKYLQSKDIFSFQIFNYFGVNIDFVLRRVVNIEAAVPPSQTLNKAAFQVHLSTPSVCCLAVPLIAPSFNKGVTGYINQLSFQQGNPDQNII